MLKLWTVNLFNSNVFKIDLTKTTWLVIESMVYSDELALNILKYGWYSTPCLSLSYLSIVSCVYFQIQAENMTSLHNSTLAERLQKANNWNLKRNKEQTVSIWLRGAVLCARKSLEGSAPHVIISPPIASELSSY